MLMLLPPSEGKRAPRRGKPLDLGCLSSPELTPARRTMLEQLQDHCRTSPADDVARTLGLSPAQHDLVALNGALTTAPAARADAVYSGVLYEALDLGSLDGSARRRATSRLAITSALFGVVRPHDRICAYRLSGGVALPGVGGVGAFWRRHLAPAMAGLLGTGLLVDLRSSVYTAFWRPSAGLASRAVTVRVLLEVDGRRSVVSHVNKATKGRLVRDVLQRADDPGTPAAFVELLGDLGWRVEPHPGKGPQVIDVIVDHV